jgi:hypothetical protein
MTSLEISEDLAARERRRARGMSIGEVSRHIREESWPNRVGVDADLRRVWDDAEPRGPDLRPERCERLRRSA